MTAGRSCAAHHKRTFWSASQKTFSVLSPECIPDQNEAKAKKNNNAHHVNYKRGMKVRVFKPLFSEYIETKRGLVACDGLLHHPDVQPRHVAAFRIWWFNVLTH